MPPVMALKKARVFVGVVLSFCIVLGSCSQKPDALNGSSIHAGATEVATFEIQCLNTKAPGLKPGEVIDANNPNPDTYPMPGEGTIPIFAIPVQVDNCGALPRGLYFPSHNLPAVIAVVNCNENIVRFKTRDYQVNETSRIGPGGMIEMHFFFTGRLARDAHGNENCWTRLLGHVTGTAKCNSNDMNQTRFDFKVDWTIDRSSPELMEAAPPGLADLRNGKHCELNPGFGCSFATEASVGCGGI
jgi:hypothetical protein